MSERLTPPDPATRAAPAHPSVMTMRPLGLNAEGEALYRALLQQPGSSLPELAPALGAAESEVAVLLPALRARGLVRSSDGVVPRWFATAPEVAVELLLMEQQVALNQARQILPELERELRRGGGREEDNYVQIVTGDATSQLPAYLQIHRAARREIVCVICPPFVVSAPDEMQAAREQARRRGVQYRSLIAPEVMQMAGWQGAVEQAIAHGERVRVLDALPFKMVLADHEWGLVPLRRDAPEGPSLKLGRTTALEALWCLFESLWEQAVPVLAANRTAWAGGELREQAENELRALVTLMASGANDKTIAEVLGISERTLMRRMNTLSARLHARTRFQCGWLAAKHSESAP